MIPDDSRPRPRVLQVAYLCSPDHGSEAGIGWNHALQTAKSFDTWVVCLETTYGDHVRRYLAEHGPIAGLTFVFVPKTAGEARWGKFPGMYYFAYNRWHRRAFRVARQLHDELKFDLVHQVNLCGYREPGYLWKLPDVPFVWGPVGGTQNYPWRFLGEAGLRGAISETLRSIANRLQHRFSPRVRRAVSRAELLLTANSTIERDFARVHHVASTRLLETGIGARTTARDEQANSGPLRILWSGDLAPWKGLSLLLKALAALPDDCPVTLRILGRGRRAKAYRRLAERLGVERHIEWLGWQPHREALAQYAWADLFAFTSLRDTSGNVVLEALAAGVPVVCLDHQGVHDMVTPECGIKIPVTRPREVIGRLAESIVTLATDDEQRARLAQGALARAEVFDWNRRGERFAELYRAVLGQGSAATAEPALVLEKV